MDWTSQSRDRAGTEPCRFMISRVWVLGQPLHWGEKGGVLACGDHDSEFDRRSAR